MTTNTASNNNFCLSISISRLYIKVTPTDTSPQMQSDAVRKFKSSPSVLLVFKFQRMYDTEYSDNLILLARRRVTKMFYRRRNVAFAVMLVISLSILPTTVLSQEEEPATKTCRGSPRACPGEESAGFCSALK